MKTKTDKVQTDEIIIDEVPAIFNDESQINPWEDKYKRAMADYQNLERRCFQQSENAVKRAKERLVVKIIQLRDHLDRASVFFTDDGLKMILDEFNKFLSEEGVMRADSSKQKYDPHLAECVEVVADAPEGIIAHVILPTYVLGDDVIRIGMVKVGGKSQG